MDNELNKQQLEAVETINGPVMVFAGAGSGKTRTLTYRIANMLEKDINPSNILAITFTNKATKEMKDRLFGLVGYKSKFLTVSTFHSLCARILRREIEVLGYRQDYEILDEEDQLKIISSVIKENNIDKKFYPVKAMRKMINRCKCFNLKPSDAVEKKIYDKYELKMKESNALDFEDLQIKTYELFKGFPNVLERYRQKYQYILVDEFQDTNTLQYKIIRALSLIHHNIFVVGDDDQSIYSFRGTNYENMKSFKRDFPEHKMIILNENYRSTQTILKYSNNLIANNSDRQSKELFSSIPSTKNDVVVYQADNEKDEVNYVCSEIKKIIKNNPDYNNIAVLYRSSIISRNFELGMIQNNIPYKIYGGVGYLRRKEIKDVIAYLKLIINHDDILSFQRIINEPTRGIGQKTVETILEYRKNNNIPLFSVFENIKLPLAKINELNKFKEIILQLEQKLDTTDLITLYDDLLAQTQYLKTYEFDEDKEEREENVYEFKSLLREIEENNPTLQPREKLLLVFDESVLVDDKQKTKEEAAKGVILSTIHSVKGLEFDTVFVVALEEGIFPNGYVFESEDECEEERRVAYVALTRAKRKLYLVNSKRRMLYGDSRYNSPSRFLTEAINASTSKKQSKDDFSEFFENEKYPSKQKEILEEGQYTSLTDDDLFVGQKVYHAIFKEGIVISVNPKFVTVCFVDDKTIKNIDKSFLQIKK